MKGKVRCVSGKANVALEDLPDLPGLVTISLAAQMLKVSRQAAHRMAQDGRLRAWRVPSAGADRPVVVDLEQVMKLQAERVKEIVVTGL